MGASSSTESVMAAKQFVEAKIGENKVVVFSKSYCPFCDMAKKALDTTEAKGKYLVIELDNRDDGSAIQDVLKQITGARTVPRVFIGGKCIGGGSETKALQESGELAVMVKN